MAESTATNAVTYTTPWGTILGDLITRNLSKRGGGESEAINTSLFPLAESLQTIGGRS
ncbi:hypothetical protein [Mesorhizobium sp.]|uniref:hypothetical protein n=1 Tax=Mesorhizobium sp. TaxID=1871066 RepID=UPI0025BB81F6|nr:hypothetical protein [Mesorhizobium sp.]